MWLLTRKSEMSLQHLYFCVFSSCVLDSVFRIVIDCPESCRFHSNTSLLVLDTWFVFLRCFYKENNLLCAFNKCSFSMNMYFLFWFQTSPEAKRQEPSLLFNYLTFCGILKRQTLSYHNGNISMIDEFDDMENGNLLPPPFWAIPKRKCLFLRMSSLWRVLESLFPILSAHCPLDLWICRILLRQLRQS